jgi:hypothetical protein
MADRIALSPAAELRVLLGLAVQPFVTALLAFVSFPVVEYTGRPLYGGRLVDPFDGAVSFAAGAGIAGLVMAVFGALPVLAWLLKRGPISRRQALIFGAVLGNVPGVLIVATLAARGLRQGAMPGLSELTYSPMGAVRAIALGSFIGAASAGVFWWIAGRHIGVEGQA